MDTNVQALKNLYEQLGGDSADVANVSTIVEMLNAISAMYKGASDAVLNPAAINNIAAVIGNQGGEILSPTITFAPTIDTSSWGNVIDFSFVIKKDNRIYFCVAQHYLTATGTTDIPMSDTYAIQFKGLGINAAQVAQAACGMQYILPTANELNLTSGTPTNVSGTTIVANTAMQSILQSITVTDDTDTVVLSCTSTAKIGMSSNIHVYCGYITLKEN